MGDVQRAGRQREAPLAITALSATTSTGSSTGFKLGEAYSNHSIQVVLSNTSAADTIKAHVEGSVSGSHWSDIAGSTWDSTTEASGDILFVTGAPLHHVRATVGTFSTHSTAAAGNPSADVYLGVAP